MKNFFAFLNQYQHISSIRGGERFGRSNYPASKAASAQNTSDCTF
jgi:hypothetical protein